MGVVYRAHDPDIERAVAIKLIRADLLDTEDQAHFLARFRREAQAAGRRAHPNIKPANIMLARNGQVKVADFGISRIDASSLTSDGVVVGTPSYMSPEQCRGAELDGRSDLFSLGAVLYELLAGSKPFAGRSAPEIYMKLLNDPAPDIAGPRPDLSPAMQSVVARSLAKHPNDRFASAEEMSTSLRAALQQPGAGDGTVVLPNRGPPPAAMAW